MSYFLLVYDRRRGQLLEERSFTDGRAALAARFATEKQYPRDSDVEIVVIGAPSREALTRSHGRYFKSLKTLLGELVAQT